MGLVADCFIAIFTFGIMCYLHYTCLLGFYFCVMLSSASCLLSILSHPSLLGMVSDVTELVWVIVLPSAGRGIGWGLVVRLILWLLEF